MAEIDALKLPPEDARAVASFSDYLRMRTDHPDPTPGYNAAGAFLEAAARAGGLQFERLELHPGAPIFILTWAGTDPTVPKP